jgi:hypothetical protein
MVGAGSPMAMGYVIAGLLVLLVVAVAVAVVMRRARKHGRGAASDAEYGRGVPGDETAILAPDAGSPLGDTSEHAGRQRDGETVSDQDAERSGGTGRSTRTSGYAGTAGVGERGRERAGDGAHRAPPVDGGEGEGRRRI